MAYSPAMPVYPKGQQLSKKQAMQSSQNADNHRLQITRLQIE